MSNVQLFSQISSLPKDLKKEVSDFVAFLKQKSEKGEKIKERQLDIQKAFLKCLMTLTNPLKTSGNIANEAFIRYPHLYLVY